MLPLQIWTRPTTMMRPRPISFPTVKTSWILVAIRTLEQFTHVSNTEQRTHRHTVKNNEEGLPVMYLFLFSFGVFGVRFSGRKGLLVILVSNTWLVFILFTLLEFEIGSVIQSVYKQQLPTKPATKMFSLLCLLYFITRFSRSLSLFYI